MMPVIVQVQVVVVSVIGRRRGRCLTLSRVAIVLKSPQARYTDLQWAVRGCVRRTFQFFVIHSWDWLRWCFP